MNQDHLAKALRARQARMGHPKKVVQQLSNEEIILICPHQKEAATQPSQKTKSSKANSFCGVAQKKKPHG